MGELIRIRDMINKMDYPTNEIIIANGEITGLGFFPAASGMSVSSEIISDKQIMILGQDQDNEAGYKTTKKLDREDYSPTWRGIQKILEACNLDLENCFFTNCLIGIRKGEKSNTGKSPMISNARYVESCLEILQAEIDIQKPKLIICLGLVPIKILSKLSSTLVNQMVLIDTFKELDTQNLGLMKDVKFNFNGDFTTNIAVISHPSYSHLNSNKREFNGVKGPQAEYAMIKEGLLE